MAADSGPVACGTGNSRLMLGSSASNCGKGAARQVALKSVALAPDLDRYGLGGAVGAGVVLSSAADGYLLQGETN